MFTTSIIGLVILHSAVIPLNLGTTERRNHE